MIASAGWLAAVPWLVPFIGLVRLGKREPNLANAPVASGTRVSIIVPARNESVTIDTIIPSLLASTYDNFELIIVDDRSTDDTAAKISAWAAHDPRVQLLRGAELPTGWFGKPWACAQGAAAASGEILLFTDSDTTHSPSVLGHAVGALYAGDIDLLTVTTYLECLTFWERLVMPQVFALLGLRYPPHRVNNATKPWDVVANGQFMMFPRLSYEAIGGHGSVRNQVVEDLALAQHCIRERKRLRLFCAETLISTRMYRSLPELIEGWSKNLHLGARESVPPGISRTLAPFGVPFAFLFWLAPLAMVFSPAIGQAGAVALGASVLFWMLMSRGMSIPIWYGILYPIGAMMSIAIVVRSIWRGGRKIVWRGRSYTVKT